MRRITERHHMDRKILERLLLGRGVKSICKELHVGNARVREVREKAREVGYLDGSTASPLAPHPLFADPVDGRTAKTSEQDRMLLEQFEWVKERLTVGWTPITVFEELPFSGVSRSSFYRFLLRHELYKIVRGISKELTAPIIHNPGEALILDWGKVRDIFDPKTQQKRTLWAFVGVLGFSRWMTVRLVWTNDVPTTLEAMESMFQEVGGIPSRMTSDNPKCFSLKADRYDPVLNPALQRFAAHYNDLAIECLPPRDPKKKGKVEKMVPFVRRLFEAYPETWVSLEHAQNYMNHKIGIANQRRHGTTCLRPIEVFLEKEKPALKSLPALSYEREEVSYPKVRRDGFVRFANKYYAVADENIDADTVVLATEKLVSIFRKGKLLEVYDRITDKYQTHAIKDHLKKPWQKVEENNLHYLELAHKIGPEVSRFVHILLSRGQGFVDTRKIWGVLSLEKKYPKEVINSAVGEALRVGELSSRFVETMAQLHRIPEKISQKEKSLEVMVASKFSRPMSVYKEQIDLFAK